MSRFKLPVDENRAKELCAKYGTPLQLYDEKGITERYKLLTETFRQYFKDFENFFAVKALPNPAILKILHNLGSGFDCSCVAEIEICRKIGVPGEKIMFTSNFTSKKDLAYAIDQNVILNLDDVSLVDSVVQVRGRCPELICFRLNPGVGKTNSESESNVLGGPSAKFGVSMGQIKAAYQQAIKHGATRFAMHMMTGTCVLDDSFWLESVSVMMKAAKQIQDELGIKFEFINIGGGIGVPYRPEEKLPDLHTVCKNVKSALQHFHNPGLKVKMENGRFVTGQFGWLFATCEAVKRNEFGVYYGLDACMANLMRPGMYGSYHHITVLGKETEKHKRSSANVVGTLCENNDWFAKQRDLPEAAVGDIFVIHDTGAHSHSMGFNYNGKLKAPEVIIRLDGSDQLIRQRETFQSLFGNTIMPSDLAN